MKYEVVAEGNANKILRKQDGTAIRVSKSGMDPQLVANYWNRFWKPKLGDYLGTLEVTHDPIYGDVLQIDEVGSPLLGREIVAEFKPKWLVQSPEAPKDAKSCRTCAIKTMRGQPLVWCSLDIARKDEHAITRLAHTIAVPGHENNVAQLLLSSSIIDLLTAWQTKLLNSLHDCMSLRDCTIMIEHSVERIAEPHLHNYEIWIVDLDPKFEIGKLEKWSRIESSLTNFYRRRNMVCRLSRN